MLRSIVFGLVGLVGLVGLAAAVAVSCGSGRAGANNEVDISRSAESEAETAVAADASGKVLLVGAIAQRPGRRSREMRAYSSSDGGRTWTTSEPAPNGRLCAHGDPAPAIGPDGRQYMGFLVGRCGAVSEDALESSLDIYVATRSGQADAWSGSTLTPQLDHVFDDKPTIAVDRSRGSPHRGRVYAAWSRRPGGPAGTVRIAASFSDDRGRTWAAPRFLPGISEGADSYYATLAIGGDGVLFVGWFDITRSVYVSRSEDGGETFAAPTKVTDALALPNGECEVAGLAIPAQPERCVTIDPNLAVGTGRLLVSWVGAGQNGMEQDVFARAYDLELRPLGDVVRVNPADGARASDQFNAALAYDSRGHFWLCYYDTAGERTRKAARFVCSVSGDGGASWKGPLAVGSVASDLSSGSTGIRDFVGHAFGFGDYEGVAAANGAAYPVWTDGRNARSGGTDIYAARIAASDVH